MAEYIEREYVLERLRKRYNDPNYWHTGEDWRMGLSLAEDVVDETPTSDVVKVKYGEWVYDQTTGAMYCSVCGVSACADECDYHLGKYCSYCGAKMVKKETPEH